jgi:hypothetical protein
MSGAPEEDLREAERLPEGPRPPDDRGGRVDAAGETLAEQIRELRKAVRRRRAKQRAEELRETRDRRRKTRGVREAVREASELASRFQSGDRSSSGGSGGRGLARRALSAVAAGATGSPGPRPHPDPEDPIARAGREAESPAPVEASLRPFGPAGSAVGPERLEMLAGGGPRRPRDRDQEEPAATPLEAFVTGDPVSNGQQAGSEPPPERREDAYSGLVSDDDLGFVYGGDRR